MTGTASVGRDGGVHAVGRPYEQAERCLAIIAEALADVDATLADVTRTRMFVTDIDLWEDFGRAHREAFEHHPPATTMVEVSRLIHPDMLIEIEADAVVGG